MRLVKSESQGKYVFEGDTTEAMSRASSHCPESLKADASAAEASCPVGGAAAQLRSHLMASRPLGRCCPVSDIFWS